MLTLVVGCLLYIFSPLYPHKLGARRNMGLIFNFVMISALFTVLTENRGPFFEIINHIWPFHAPKLILKLTRDAAFSKMGA